jgi:hypothetical protein
MDRALARLVAIGIAAVSAIVVADAQVVLYEHSLAPYGSTSLASPLSRAGDVDADGVEDYAIGDTNNASHGAAAGRVAVFSGRTGAQIREFFGAAHDQFGTSIASVGDLDADGHADLVVGAPEVSSTGARGRTGEPTTWHLSRPRGRGPRRRRPGRRS